MNREIVYILRDYVGHLQRLQYYDLSTQNEDIFVASSVNEHKDKWMYIMNLLRSFCDHEWTTDHFEHKENMFPVTYCKYCENTMLNTDT